MKWEKFHLKNLGSAACAYVIACAALLSMPLLDGESSTKGTAHDLRSLLGPWIYLLAFVPAIVVLTSSEEVEIPWKNVSEFLAVVGTAFYYSHTLARLSGTALWIPVELRNMVNLLVSLLGAAVFNYVRNRKEKAESAEGKELFEKATNGLKKLNGADNYTEKDEKAQKQVQAVESEQSQLAVLLDNKNKYRQMIAARYKRRTEKRYLRFGLASFVGALCVFGGFMYLRAKCVRGFDVRDYLANQHRDNKRATTQGFELPDQIVLSDGPTTQAVPLNEYEYHIPEFVDIARQQVYLPIVLPDALKKYIQQAGESTDAVDTDGLTYELTAEPDYLFTAIEHTAAWQIAATNSLFLLLDAAIISLVAAGLACFFDIREAIGEMLGG